MRIMRYVGLGVLGLLGASGVVCLLVAVSLGVVRFGLDDAARGQLAARILTWALPGQFAIDAIGLQLPASVDVHRARIKAPSGQEVVNVEQLHASLRLVPLLMGRVEVRDVVIQSPKVYITEKADAPCPDIEAAFTPPDDGQPSKGASMAVDIGPITVRDAYVEVRVPDVDLRIENIAVDDAVFWVKGTSIGTSAHVTCSARLDANKTPVRVNGLDLRVSDASYRFATNDRLVLAPQVLLHFDGLTLQGALQLAATDDTLGEFQTWASLLVDAPTLQRALPDQATLLKTLRGTLQGIVVLSGAEDAQHFAVDLHGNGTSASPQMYGVRLDALQADGSMRGASLLLDSFKMRVMGAPVSASGSVALMPNSKTMAGRHDVHFSTEGLPLRQILGPWVKSPKLLPEQVSMSFRSHGRSLWPMTSEVDIALRAAHTEASFLPGVEGKLIAEGKVLTHPDCIELLAVRTGSTKGAQVTLQGIVPLRPDGFADLIRGLHTLPD